MNFNDRPVRDLACCFCGKILQNYAYMFSSDGSEGFIKKIRQMDDTYFILINKEIFILDNNLKYIKKIKPYKFDNFYKKCRTCKVDYYEFTQERDDWENNIYSFQYYHKGLKDHLFVSICFGNENDTEFFLEVTPSYHDLENHPPIINESIDIDINTLHRKSFKQLSSMIDDLLLFK